MSQKKWQINGKEFELDLTDADAVERYENAFEDMTDAEKLIPKDGKASERIRACCNLFKELFSKLFGADASDKIFSEVPTSISAYEEIYYDFLSFAQAQFEADTKHRAERLAKYTPNRQQRRAKKK